MSYPADLKYTQTHEWLRTDGAVVTVGVTWFAQDYMGDVVRRGAARSGRRGFSR